MFFGALQYNAIAKPRKGRIPPIENRKGVARTGNHDHTIALGVMSRALRNVMREVQDMAGFVASLGED